MISLQVLRENSEQQRFERQRVDDRARTIDRAAADAMAARLRRELRGEVRFDRGSRALYATDAANYRQVPIGVVIPHSLEDVLATVDIAREFGAPLLSRGGGTSLAGQCCNVAVIMDFSKHLNRVLDIDPRRRLARVQTGCVLDTLRAEARRHGLTFGPDPATHSHCTIGGMLGNNSCGVHSLLSGKHGHGLRTSDNTHSIDVLTYGGDRFEVGATTTRQLARIIHGGGARGDIYRRLAELLERYGQLIRTRMPRLPRRVSGYNLDDLLPENEFHVARSLVGTESTCGVFLEATLHLVPEPAARTLLILGYREAHLAGDHVSEILEFEPIGLEGIDQRLFDWVRQKGDRNADLKLLPEGGGWLLVEFGGGSQKDADDQARRLMDRLRREPSAPTMKLLDDPREQEMVWQVREGALGSTAWVPGRPDTWPGFEDSAVPPDQVGPYLRDLRKLLDKYNYETSLYGHFGQGCIHCRIGFDLYTADGIRTYRSFMEEATDLVVSYGGSLSGEHGDGQSRAEFLPKMYGEELVQAFREFKSIWDPDGSMNPGKVVDPYRMDENLRLGPDYNPPQPETYFSFADDHNSFARASLRCVGVGKCRRDGGGVMCPSYMVTREEKHSTRGRARLLWEMFNGEVLTDGWESEEVKEALDLCLACKGCKNDCPVNVDMATYKAEFLAHYYQRRRRPRHAYAFGFIHTWAKLASQAPEVANFFSQTPILRNLAKWAAGASQHRSLPAFAQQPFTTWFRQHETINPTGPPVILFADTFNNFFHPETAIAALEVLERAGFRVTVPSMDMCCGRPLYDYGLLSTARRYLLQILHHLKPAIEAGVPMVVLEPSCAAVFRDELVGMLPREMNAHRLKSQTFVLSEFLEKYAGDLTLPRLDRKALVHAHCHHRSIMGFQDEERLLRRMGLDIHVPEAGCCGMAGSFGYEAGEHRDVSVRCGERVLLPEVRRTPGDTLVIADGFSCREQIRQEAGRSPLHLAQVLQMAIRRTRPDSRVHATDAMQSRRRDKGGVRAVHVAAFAAGIALSAWLIGGSVNARRKSRVNSPRSRC